MPPVDNDGDGSSSPVIPGALGTPIEYIKPLAGITLYDNKGSINDTYNRILYHDELDFLDSGKWWLITLSVHMTFKQDTTGIPIRFIFIRKDMNNLIMGYNHLAYPQVSSGFNVSFIYNEDTYGKFDIRCVGGNGKNITFSEAAKILLHAVKLQ